MSERLPTLRVASARGASCVAAFVAGLPGASESQRVEVPGLGVAFVLRERPLSPSQQGDPVGSIFIPAESTEIAEREAERAVGEALQRYKTREPVQDGRAKESEDRSDQAEEPKDLAARGGPTTDEIEAVRHLESRSAAFDLARQLLREIEAEPRSFSEAPREEREQRATLNIWIARALRDANVLSQAEYVHKASFWALTVIHHNRFMAGDYDATLEPISQEIAEFEAEHGLASGETWQRGEGPPELQALERRWETAFKATEISVLRDLALDDIATKRESDPAGIGRLARRAAVRLSTNPSGPKNCEQRLEELATRYLLDATLAEKAGAYYAAAAMMGAALEALLLLRCFQDPEGVHLALEYFLDEKWTKQRLTRWTLDNLICVAGAAGWLGSGDTTDALPPECWARLVKNKRNLLHAGKHLEELPAKVIDEETTKDLRAMLVLLRSAISHFQS
ncbi:MAG: hypothetical protein IPJ17_01345 [Holophagales bacterium]|nr:MAG: hypothetical protein IPJ17_01345 [Holophagales bacterium]